MNNAILNLLKDSENFDEFLSQADQYIADEIGKDTGRNPYNILHDEIVDYAKEIWTEYVNNSI
jgi:hypothetical protein